MPPAPAARLGDKTTHGGTIGPPVFPPGVAARVATVLIEGVPAAVIGSVHACVKPPDPALGPANVIIQNPPAPPRRVLIGGLPAAVITDRITCQAQFLPRPGTVLIGGPL